MKRRHNFIKRVLALVLSLSMVFSTLSYPFSFAYAGNEEPTFEKEFSEAVTLDDVTISVTANAGVFPDGSELIINKVSKKTAKKVDQALDTLILDNLANQYVYDIKIMHNGKEVEPNTNMGDANITFMMNGYSSILSSNVYHISDNYNVDELNSSVEDNILSVSTNSFSIFVVLFTYDELTYTLNGYQSVLLSDILDALEISGTVSNATITDSNLVSVERSGLDYILTASEPFTTTEILTVEMAEGFIYDISLTDDLLEGDTLTVSGNAFTLNEQTGKYEATIHFGDNTEFKFNGRSNLEFSYVKVSDYSDDADWNELTNGENWLNILPGSYYIGFTDNSTVASFDDSFLLIVEKGKIASGSVNWSEGDTNIAESVRPMETVTGGALLPNAVLTNYILSLYKEGVDAPIWTGESSVTQYSLRSTIEANGFGNYRFSIKYLSGNATCYLNSDEVYSPWYTYRDTTFPSIISFAPDTTLNKLFAVVRDNETGIYSYAFTKETEEDVVEFIDIDNPSLGEVTLNSEITTGGIYYLYIKDQAGNVTKSNTPIYVTIVKYNNIYQNGSIQSEITNFYYGQEDIMLLNPSRTGFNFGGYFSALTEGNLVFGSDDLVITASDEAFAKTTTVYALWTSVDVSVYISTNDELVKEYDGEYITLTATPVTNLDLTDDNVSINYTWYKDNEIVQGENSDTLRIMNVNDSGVYKVVLTVSIVGEDNVVAYTSDENAKSVSITKKDLEISANDRTLTYGSEISSELTYADFNFDGVVEGDEESITLGALSSSDYVVGSSVGTYFIVPINFESQNYNISYLETKNLEVVPKEFSGTITLEYLETTYDGTEKKPTVTIVDTDTNETLVENVDFTLSYLSPVNANTDAKVNITFIGNYEGNRSESYVINKASFNPAIIISDFKYGESLPLPVITPLDLDGNVLDSLVIPEDKISYYLKNGDSFREVTLSEIESLDAGTYEVKIKVDELSNYAESTSLSSSEFDVLKRTVIFKTESGSWIYDGSSHALPTVSVLSEATIDGITYISDGFTNKDGYRALFANSSVTNVTATPVVNTITVELSSSTNADNYNIIKVEGDLEVTPSKLIPPSGIEWSAQNPGTIEFIAVYRQGLDVKYEIELYRDNIKVGESIETASSSYDFSDIMKADSEVNGPGEYSVRIKTIPVSSNNFTESDFSNYSDEINTVKVNVFKDQGVNSALINGEDSIFLVRGESANLSSTFKDGYTEALNIWEADPSENVVISNIRSANTTVRVDGECGVYNVYAYSLNENPSAFLDFDSDYYSRYQNDMTEVYLHGYVVDSLDLEAYAILNSTNPSLTLDDLDDLEDINWIDISDENNHYAFDYEVDNPGYYYLIAKDSSNGYAITEVVKVYSISFNSGDGTGSMSSILKVDGYDITLPENEFEKIGYNFTQWTSSNEGKIFVDKASYTDDLNATLTANWSNAIFNYQVKYHFMGLDGEYNEEPTVSQFTATINTVVNSTNPAISRTQTGFTFDSAISDSSIEITEDNLVLNLYYSRNKYDITYSYTDVDGSNVNLTEKETYYYGESLDEELDKIERSGYSFIGWIYSNGSRPAVMPANNLTATGSFSSLPTEFYVHYFVEKLDGTGFIEMEHETRTEKAGESITFDLDINKGFCKEFDGFTVKSVAVNNGSLVTSDQDLTEVSGYILEESKLYVSYFYTRNEYKVTLNVLKSDNTIYEASWNYKYGEDLTDISSNIATYYENAIVGGNLAYFDAPDNVNVNENVDLTGYILANYIDYSTGVSPVSMPNGDVTIVREYISDIEHEYYVNVYFENADGTYTRRARLSYFAPVGYLVSVIEGSTTTDRYNVYTDQLKALIDGFNHYELATSTSGFVASGDTLEIDAYFDRKVYTAHVYYYYNTNSTNVSDAFKRLDITGKWGTNTTVINGSTITGFDPLKYFDDENELVDGVTYKDNRCVVSYNSYYYVNGNYWPQYQFNTVASLTSGEYANNSSSKVLFGQSDITIYVRYSQIQDVMFKLDVKYNEYEGSQKDVKYPYSYNGEDETDYTFTIVNKREIYNATFTSNLGDVTSYPGLYDLYKNGSFTYSGIKSDLGYVELTDLDLLDGSTSYKYFINTNDTEKVIYIVVDGYEDMYDGNRYGITINNSIPDILMQEYIADYNSQGGRQITFNNRSASGIRKLVNNQTSFTDGTYVFSFRAKYEYRVYHSVYGNSCSGHIVYEGDSLSVEDISSLENGCSHVISSRELRPGYVLKFYKNASYTEEITAQNNVNHDITYYGKYVKDTINYHKYAYFKLKNAVAGLEYINASDIVEDNGSYYILLNGELTQLNRVDSTLEAYTISDGQGNTMSVTPVASKYMLNGETVLIDELHKTYSLSEIQMDYEDYAISNFHFSENNPQNRLNAYIETSAVSLKAYFERDKFSLTKNEENETDILVDSYFFGTTITLDKPVKDGYTFDSWDFTDNEDNEVTFAISYVDGQATFDMPTKDINATAKWLKNDLDVKVSHFFQTNANSYLETLLNETLNSDELTITDVNVSLDGAQSVSGKGYFVDGVLKFVSLTDSRYETMYLVSSSNSGVYSVFTADKFAATEEVSFEIESEIEFSDYELTDDNYILNNALVKTSKDTQSMSDSDTFEVKFGASVNYYYERLKKYEINSTIVATDNDSISATITVSGGEAGKFSYGENFTITETTPQGFVFEGWFDDSILDSDGKLISTWTDVTPLSVDRNPSYSSRIFEDTTLVAVFSPLELPADARVTINPLSSTYDYGYLEGDIRNISSTVLLPAGTDSTVKVKSYTWVKCDSEGNVTDLESMSNAGNYKIPVGLVPGSYYYKCIVVLERTDNNRSLTLVSPLAEVIVNKKDFSSEVTNYEGIYDGEYHGIKVDLVSPENLSEDDFTVYYSEAELTADNYETSGTENILKKDVLVGSEYTIYYAVIPNDNVAHLYNPEFSSGTIKINPKKLTLKLSDAFTKVFDESASVLGDITDPTSDKYRLSYGEDQKTYYEVVGLEIGDEIGSTLGKNTIDFDATYNSAHVSEAGSIIINNIKLVSATDPSAINNNYYFEDTYKLGISGTIVQKEYDIVWNIDPNDNGTFDSDNNKATYTFNGEVHAPIASVTGLPEGLELIYEGAQTNAGTGYIAQATLRATDPNLDARDYKLNNATCTFDINKVSIAIKSSDTTLTYDGELHNISQFEIGDSVITSGGIVTANGKEYKIYSVNVSKDDSSIRNFKNAGEYSFVPTNISITNMNDINVIDNFEISILEGTLKINPRKVVVSNIKANDKDYDSLTTATLDISEVEFIDLEGNSVIVTGDFLALDITKITGTFVDSNVGNDKIVNIEIEPSALLNGNTNEQATNYILYVEENETVQKASATADIRKNNIVIKVGDFSDITYGDNVDLKASYVSGLKENDTLDTLVSGSLIFTFTGNKEYTYTYVIPENNKVSLSELNALSTALFTDLRLDAGNYTVNVDVTQLVSDNYTFENSNINDTFTVSKKKISISGKDIEEGFELTKEYDKTTNVTDSEKNLVLNNQDKYFEFSGVLDGDAVNVSGFNAAYDDCNVDEGSFIGAKNINVTGITLTNDNYELVLDSLSLDGSISKKPLSIKISDLSYVYGTNNSDISFKSTPTGLVSGDNINDVVGLKYVTTYDSENPSMRNVIYDGSTIVGYPITLDIANLEWHTANYSISLDDVTSGSLKITKKEVTVGVTENTEVGFEPVIDSEGNFSMTYGEDIDGHWFKPLYLGFIYNEDSAYNNLTDDLVSLYIMIKGEKVAFTLDSTAFPNIAGNYAVSVDVTELNNINGNYSYKAVPNRTLVVNRKMITLSDIISILSKVYDGKTEVSVSQIRIDGNSDVILSNNGENYSADSFNYSYFGINQILDIDIEYLENNKSTGLTFDLDETVYTDKNVGIRDVNLSFGLNEYLVSRYSIEALTLQDTAQSEITRRPLVISVVAPENIIYGSLIPVYENTYDSFAEGEDVSVLNRITDIPQSTDLLQVVQRENGEIFLSEYVGVSTLYTEIGEAYVVTPTGFIAGENGNYLVSYNSATMVVSRTKLDTPEVTWSEDEPGFVSFTGVNGIGDVEVERYELKLYKADDTGLLINGINLTNIPLDSSFNDVVPGESYDLFDAIKSNGVGEYYVSIRAIASEENNELKANVSDSDLGLTDKLHCLNVKFKFNESDLTTNSYVDKAVLSETEAQVTLGISGNSLLVSSDAKEVTYLAIEGEKNIPLSLLSTGELATGYVVKNVDSSGTNSSSITFGGKTGSFIDDEYRFNSSFGITFGSINSLDDININLTIETVKATLTAVLSIEERIGDGSDLTDNVTYGYTNSPVLKIESSVLNIDTVDTSEYTYSYVWNIKKQGTSGSGDSIVSTDTTNVSTLTFPVGKVFGTYFVTCTIVATRKDNGESTVSYVTNKELGTTNGRFTIYVTKASYIPTVSISDWMYGEDRVAPTTQNIPEEISSVTSSIVYYYSESNDVSGEWSVNSAPNGWSKSVPTNVGTYYVTAVIPEQTNFDQMVASPVKFEITKNTFGKTNEITLDTCDDANNSYGTLKWEKVGNISENRGNNSASIAIPKYDITLEYSADNTSYVELKKETSISYAENGLDYSEYFTNPGRYRVSITAVPDKNSERDLNNVNRGESVVKEFVVLDLLDNVNGVLDKVYDAEEIILTCDLDDAEYEWFKDGDKISNSGKTIDLTFVKDSGTYYANATKDNVTYFTIKKDVNISKRTIVVTTDGHTRKYDGTPLQVSTKTIENVPLRDTVHYMNTGIITDFGETDNTYTLSITHDDGTNDILNDNYNVESNLGKLKIEKRVVTLTSPTRSEEYNGEYLIDKNIVVSGDKFVENEGATYDVTGKQLTIGKSDNTFTYTLLDNTKAINYSISVSIGELEVRQVSNKITITANSDYKVYDGEVLRNAGFTYTDNIVASTDEVLAVVEGEIIDLGTTDNVVTSYRIMHGDLDVTDCYSFNESVKGTLEIKKVLTPITITANSNYKEYDGTPLTDSGYTFTDGIVRSTDQLTAVVEGTITFLGTEPNVVTSYKIMRGNIDATKNYTFTDSIDGTLEIKVVSTPITITANSKDKVYDGTVLTDSGYTFTDNIIVAGDTLSAVVEGSILDIGKEPNVVTSYKVMRGEIDVTNCYSFNEPVSGELEIKEVGSPITITANSKDKVYDGTPLTDSGFTFTDGILISGDELVAVVEGEITDLGTTENVVTSYKVMRGDTDVTSNYVFAEPVKGTLEIKKILTPITITANSKDKVYDGTVLTDSGYTFTDNIIVAGDTLSAVVEGEITNKGKEPNVVTSYKVMRGNIDATKNYTFNEPVKGELEITPRPVELTWSDDDLLYTGLEQTITATVINKQGSDSDLDFTFTYEDNTPNVNKATEVGNYKAIVTSIGNDNYTILESLGAKGITHDWKISYLVVSDRAEIVPVDNGHLSSYDWYNSDVHVVAPSGFMICDTRDGEYVEYLEVTFEGESNISYHLKQIETGAITDVITEAIRNKNDNSGTEIVSSVFIDKTNPTGNITVGSDLFEGTTNTDKYFYKDSVSAALTGFDEEAMNNSGVAKVSYKLNVEEEWVDANNLTIDATYKGNILVKVTDKADNTYEFATNLISVFKNPEKLTDSITYTRTTRVSKDVYVTLNDNTIKDVSDENRVLTLGVDYKVLGNKITLLPKYLETKNVGTYELIVSYNPMGETYEANGDLEAIADTTFTLKVIRAKDTITNISDQSKVYDTNPVTDVTYNVNSTGRVTITYTGLTDKGEEYNSTEKPTEAGKYTVHISVASDRNYESSSGVKDFVIEKAKVTIGAKDKKSYKGDPLKELEYTVLGTVYNDELGVITAVSDVTNEEVGKYNITITYTENPNYEVEIIDGTYEIEKKTLGYIISELLKGSCFWHWIILGANVVSMLTLLLTNRRKEYDSEDDKKDAKKKSKRNRTIGSAILATIDVISNIFGSCILELILTGVTIITVLPTMIMTYRHKFKEKEN